MMVVNGPVRSVRNAAGAVLLFAVTAGAQSQPTRVVGDLAVGKALFEGAGTCVSCHSIEAGGRKSGPDLSWIGMLRTQDSLRRAVVAHQVTRPLAAADIDHLVAYLRTLRSIPPTDPRERT